LLPSLQHRHYTICTKAAKGEMKETEEKEHKTDKEYKGYGKTEQQHT
jgi:hypothetical protein